MQDNVVSLPPWSKSIKWIFYGMVILFLSLFISKLGWYDISVQLGKVGWKFWLVIPINILAYLFATISWRYCMGSEKKYHSLQNLFVVRHIGESLAIINPTNVIAGDGAKQLLLKQNCHNTDACLSSILLSRILIIIAAILLAGFSVSAIIMNQMTNEFPMGSMMILGLIILFGLMQFWRLFTHRKLYLYNISSILLAPFKDKEIISNILYKIKHVNYEISKFRQKEKRALLAAFFFATMHWMMGAVEFCLILFLLNLPIGFLDGLIVEMGVAVLKSTGSFIPGQIGIEEYGNKIMLTTIGLSSSVIWISVSILRRMRQFIWLAVGVIFYIFTKDRLNGGTIYNP